MRVCAELFSHFEYKLLCVCEISSQEHPSSDSFYDSDGDGGSDLTTVERPGSERNAPQQEEEIAEERLRHDSTEVDGTCEEFSKECSIILVREYFIKVD